MKYTFNRMVGDFIKNLVEEYQQEGKKFVLAKGNRLVDVSESLHSGGLTPLLIWELDNRRFEMFEGYRRIGPIDWFKHNCRVNLISDGSMYLGVRVANIVEENLAMSKQDFLLHIADAMDSLYKSSPSGSVYLDENKENKFTHHLTEKQQKEQEAFDNMRVLDPMVKRFQNWRALFESFAITALSDPNIAREYKFEDDLTYQLVKDRLVKLNGVDMPSNLFGRGFEPYHKQLDNFIKNKELQNKDLNTINQHELLDKNQKATLTKNKISIGTNM